MKKVIFGVSLALAIGSPVFAADNTAEMITSGENIILSDCTLLADDITPTLSSGVLGGYFCRVGAAGTTNEVVVASCHQNGRTATRTVETPCTNTTPVPTGQVACTDPTKSVNTSNSNGASIFVGRTSGGAIGPAELDGSVCDVAGVEGKLE